MTDSGVWPIEILFGKWCENIRNQVLAQKWWFVVENNIFLNICSSLAHNLNIMSFEICSYTTADISGIMIVTSLFLKGIIMFEKW